MFGVGFRLGLGLRVSVWVRAKFKNFNAELFYADSVSQEA